MDLQTHLAVIAQQISDDLGDHTFGASCGVPDVVITAGRPAAPLNSCTRVYVWLDSVYDAGEQSTFGATSGPDCVSRRVAVFGVEIGICLSDPGDEGLAWIATSLFEAECLNDLTDVVWCGLAEAAQAGEFGDCQGVTVGTFNVQPRAGQWVSMLGSITLDAGCDLTPGS